MKPNWKVGDLCRVWGNGDVLYQILEIGDGCVLLSDLGGWHSFKSLRQPKKTKFYLDGFVYTKEGDIITCYLGEDPNDPESEHIFTIHQDHIYNLVNGISQIQDQFEL